MDEEHPIHWFKAAETDLYYANYQFKDGENSYRRVCYDCHLVAEKLHKAFLISNNMFDFPRTHSLLQLNDHCSRFNILFKTLIPECKRLNIYGFNTKYPSKLLLTKDDVLQALNDADTVLHFPPIALAYANAKVDYETNYTCTEISMTTKIKTDDEFDPEI